MTKPLLVLLFLPWAAFLAAADEKPNIVLFLVDDMGLMDTSVPMLADEGGDAVPQALNTWYRTPNMERLAAQGIRFSQFYAHTVCSPTRISLMTGQNSARHRTTQFIGPDGKNTGAKGPPDWNWAGLDADDVTLPRLLQEVGYRTIHVGKAHFGPVGHEGEDPSKLGFDVNVAGCAYGQPGSYYGTDGYGNLNPKRKKRAVPGLEKYHKTETFLTEALTVEAKARVDEALVMEMPFFLYLSHYAVHSPFQSDSRFAEHYTGSDKGRAGEAFATLVEGIDKSLGDLMEHLKERKVADRTLILFMGDNGTAAPIGGTDAIKAAAPLRGKKASCWEGGTRVPFMAAWAEPRSSHLLQQKLPIQAGSIETRMAVCYDLFPTIASLAEAKRPERHVVDGHDLGALLRGEVGNRPEVFLSHFPHRHASSYFTTYREGDWKLLYRYFPETSKQEKHHALFHLGNDPSESHDLAERHPNEVKRLVASMIRVLDDMGALFPVVNGQAVRPIAP